MIKELAQHHEHKADRLNSEAHQPFSREVIELYAKPFWSR